MALVSEWSTLKNDELSKHLLEFNLNLDKH